MSIDSSFKEFSCKRELGHGKSMSVEKGKVMRQEQKELLGRCP